jgi:hypothetical protein
MIDTSTVKVPNKPSTKKGKKGPKTEEEIKKEKIALRVQYGQYGLHNAINLAI